MWTLYPWRNKKHDKDDVTFNISPRLKLSSSSAVALKSYLAMASMIQPGRCDKTQQICGICSLFPYCRAKEKTMRSREDEHSSNDLRFLSTCLSLSLSPASLSRRDPHIKVTARNLERNQKGLLQSHRSRYCWRERAIRAYSRRFNGPRPTKQLAVEAKAPHKEEGNPSVWRLERPITRRGNSARTN